MQSRHTVPTDCVDTCVEFRSRMRLRPKSASLHAKPRVSLTVDLSSTLAGFRSPWTMPSPCRYCQLHSSTFRTAVWLMVGCRAHQQLVLSMPGCTDAQMHRCGGQRAKVCLHTCMPVATSTSDLYTLACRYAITQGLAKAKMAE